ncbi:HD domain-containing protein [Paenibacillus lautus]|uniref:HD domain-containing protein n=1 Tax=Paenibacillus lautus TaxID=1401 RepID=UPI001C7DE1DD|nr:HD domain-containing protein [Paenibacillus lautus]MBX4152392.1 GTP pyrophosphokinase [Paenibacillus lautus]
MSQLEEAIVLATAAHKDQTDKGGHPYILHPLRVMMKMKTEEEMIVAVLHDIIEDTSITYEYLKKEGFTSSIIESITALTRMPDESYFDFINRCKQNETARKVKIQDLSDNMNLSRMGDMDLTEKDYSRQKKYSKALRILLG